MIKKPSAEFIKQEKRKLICLKAEIIKTKIQYKYDLDKLKNDLKLTRNNLKSYEC